MAKDKLLAKAAAGANPPAERVQNAPQMPAPPWKLNDELSRLSALVGHVSIYFGAIADTEPFSASCYVREGYCSARGKTAGHAVKRLCALVASTLGTERAAGANGRG